MIPWSTEGWTRPFQCVLLLEPEIARHDEIYESMKAIHHAAFINAETTRGLFYRPVLSINEKGFIGGNFAGDSSRTEGRHFVARQEQVPL